MMRTMAGPLTVISLFWYGSAHWQVTPSLSLISFTNSHVLYFFISFIFSLFLHSNAANILMFLILIPWYLFSVHILFRLNSDLGGAKFQITDSQLKYWNGSSWVTATPQPNGFLRTASVSGWGQTASIVVGNKYYKSIKWETRDYIHIVNLQLYDNSGNLLISKDLMNKFTGGGGIKNNETGTVDLAQYESYNVDQLIFTATCNMNGGTGYLTISAN